MTGVQTCALPISVKIDNWVTLFCAVSVYVRVYLCVYVCVSLRVFQMFEVAEGAQGSVTSCHSFEPAHQEGLESLLVQGDSLYTGARDACIKRWDLTSKRLLQVACSRTLMKSTQGLRNSV